MLIFEESFWETGVPREKPLRAKERTNNKLNPHMVPTPGFEAGPHWWEASALITAPSLAPLHTFFGFEGKFSTLSPRDVQPTFLYSRRGFEFPCTSEHRQTKLYTYSFWLRREIQNNIKINLDHSKQWVWMTFHFLCEMGCLCIYVYLEFS